MGWMKIKMDLVFEETLKGYRRSPSIDLENKT